MAFSKAKSRNRADLNSAAQPYGVDIKPETSGPSIEKSGNQKAGGRNWDNTFDAQGGSRKEQKTPWDYSKVNDKSSTGIGDLRGGMGKRNRADLGHGKGKHTPPVGTAMLGPTDMSNPGVPAEPTKWYRKTRTAGKGAYNLVVPASEKEALPYTARMKRVGKRSPAREEFDY
jgi:hypothetical protein